MALLMHVLWAVCASPLWGHVNCLPLSLHAPEQLVPREAFIAGPHRSALPPGLASLLVPPAGLGDPRGTQHSPPGPAPFTPGPVDVWCGLRQVSVRVDRLRVRPWSIPGLFQLGSCGVSAASPRYLYFHRGLKECGESAHVVGGQMVYTYSLTYTAPRHGHVLRVPPLSMVLSCHYDRFHYSYGMGFHPQSASSVFLKSMHRENSFSLSVCNSQWEVLPPEHRFVLGEPVYFRAQTRALQAGERIYVDSCHVTSSRHPSSSPTLDIITNFGCMVDSVRADSSSHFIWRGPSELRFSVDSLLFSSEGQMLFLHCSMSVGLQPSPSSKSCTYNKVTGRWMELEAFQSVCTCCESLCVDFQGPGSTRVSSTPWNIAQPPGQVHYDVSLKTRGQGLMDGLNQGVSLKTGGQGLMDKLNQGAVSLKMGQGLNNDMSLKMRGLSLAEERLQDYVSLKTGGLGLMDELQMGGQGLTEENLQEDVSLKTGGQRLMNELNQGTVSLMRGQGLTENLQNYVSVETGGQGLMKKLNEGDQWVHRRGDSLEKETETQPQLSSSVSNSTLTNHTSAQTQSVTVAAADLSTAAGLGS